MYEIWKQIEYDNRYEISNFGRIRKKNPKNGYRYLKQFRKFKRVLWVVKINGKEFIVARLVANAFIKKLTDKDFIYHKNRIEKDNFYRNLEVISKSEMGKRTGGISRGKRVVLIENNDISRIWKSSRKAANDLYISRQTVSDYCNNKTKSKMYNLMWEDDFLG